MWYFSTLILHAAYLSVYFKQLGGSGCTHFLLNLKIQIWYKVEAWTSDATWLTLTIGDGINLVKTNEPQTMSRTFYLFYKFSFKAFAIKLRNIWSTRLACLYMYGEKSYCWCTSTIVFRCTSDYLCLTSVISYISLYLLCNMCCVNLICLRWKNGLCNFFTHSKEKK